MKILALEFSSPVRAVAVHGGMRPGYAEESGAGPSGKPFALIEAALQQAEIRREDIECVAVGLGPGSNAGVRTAIAIAQGWQLAHGVKLLGISSADVVAAHGGQFGAAESVTVGLDVRAGELWVALYNASDFKRPKLIAPFRRVGGEEMAPQMMFRMDLTHEVAQARGAVGLFPEADFLALLAANRANFICGDELEPVNLRPVDFVKAPSPKFVAE